MGDKPAPSSSAKSSRATSRATSRAPSRTPRKKQRDDDTDMSLDAAVAKLRLNTPGSGKKKGKAVVEEDVECVYHYLTFDHSADIS